MKNKRKKDSNNSIVNTNILYKNPRCASQVCTSRMCIADVHIVKVSLKYLIDQETIYTSLLGFEALDIVYNTQDREWGGGGGQPQLANTLKLYHTYKYLVSFSMSLYGIGANHNITYRTPLYVRGV